MSTLKSKLQSAQTEFMNASATNSIGEFYNASVNAGMPNGAETADAIMAQQAMSDCMMTLVTSMESTQVYKDKNNVVHSKPIEHFYFCPRGGLTIGYGTKIECNKQGYPEKEGLAILEKTKLLRNGKPLSLKEKTELVKSCYDRRTYCKTRAKKKINLNVLSPEDQKAYLFNKEDYATIDSQNALEISRLEYEDKKRKLITANPFIKDSYFLEALGTDFHYQFGDTGIQGTTIYKKALKKEIPNPLYAGKEKAVTDREKLRDLICKLAYETNQDKKKRKGQPATPESQSAFCIKALKKFCDTFKDGIMMRQDHKTLLLENYMTLVFAQSMKNVKNRDLTLNEVQQAQQMAHTLVYDELYNSPTIQQVPDRIKPITMLESLKNIKLPEKTTQTDKNPLMLIRDSLNKEAEKRIQSFNKKFKTDHSFETPDDPIRDFSIVANMQNGRWRS